MDDQNYSDINWEGKTVLVAEDEEINFLFIDTILSKTKVRVIHAWNGKQAVEYIKKNNTVDLVLMDIKMPIMDGFTATKKIKALRSSLPIIAQTAYTLSDDREKCIEIGCVSYLTKPIRKNELLSEVKKHML